MGCYRIEWSTDRNIAQGILTNPLVWPWVSDDSCDLNTFEFPEIDGEKIRMAVCIDDNQIYGCFIFFEKSNNITEIHTCLTGHGKARHFGDQVVKKVFTDTDYDAIETFIPVDNPSARKLAIKCGFKYVGLKDPIIKSGLPVPVEAWELKKCQQQ